MLKKKYFSFIDLFAGIGGFRIALNAQGGDCLGFSEIDSDAITTYCENFSESETKNFGDIKYIDNLPQHDLLTAGVPCQSWSIAGRNLGFDDDRGQLWNDTLYLLQKSQPKAFLFENVKGLSDPRNKSALKYILDRIKLAGYFANYYVINALDYGVFQNRIRIYIVGFREQQFFDRFKLPKPQSQNKTLGELFGLDVQIPDQPKVNQLYLFEDFPSSTISRSMSLSNTYGFNDYFLFNDIRNGHTTIHSWDIINTTQRQKDICYLLLKNRRKNAYGKLDGNPLSLKQFQNLDSSIAQKELDELVKIGILGIEEYEFIIENPSLKNLSNGEIDILQCARDKKLNIDEIKGDRSIKIKKVPISKTIHSLKVKGAIKCQEYRFDFKNTKISTGLFGVSRIFLPSSSVFPTLVSTDTNDYVATKDIKPNNIEEYKKQFIDEIYKPGLYRKITQSEACLIQGFPRSFKLPDARSRWMRLIGNSVSIPVIEMLCQAIIETNVFSD
ncbi:MAG: DNA cytosine methyltransferase [Prochlorotrichaceae cyanobacterium]|jgi:DNA (cytosine-5)-methyltransferase 1